MAHSDSKQTQKIEYPPNVRDKKAYLEMLEYTNHAYFTDKKVRFVHTSDVNVVIDLQAITL